MATSAAFDVLDALYARLAGLPELADPVRVYDGPYVTEEMPVDSVFVGYDGDPEGDLQAFTFEQDWAHAGYRAKDETLSIPCCVISYTGDANAVRDRRERVQALLAAIETALRADPTLGVSSTTRAQVRRGALHQEPTSDGVRARLVFWVDVDTRI